MAGRGPAPKHPDERARTNAPERGEWLSLPPLERKILPVLPRPTRREGAWPARTLRLWTAWRADWVTGFYGDAEIAMAVELAYLHALSVTDPTTARSAEVRQWMDRLGLTPKGKRDLRLRLAVDESVVVAADEQTEVEANDQLYGDLHVVA